MIIKIFEFLDNLFYFKKLCTTSNKIIFKNINVDSFV